MNTFHEIIELLRSMGEKRNIEGMKKYGIVSNAEILGVPKPELRKLAKNIGKNHSLALQLWETKIHEARILASLIADPEKVNEELMEKWVKEIDNWDLCDQCVMNLFWKTRFAHRKAKEWVLRNEEFVKRAGFALMAKLAIGDKKADNSTFEEFFPYIIEGAKDERKYVMKAVSWVLRQIGKRNQYLNSRAIQLAKELQKMGFKSARYIASEALRELTSKKIQDKLKKRTLRNYLT